MAEPNNLHIESIKSLVFLLPSQRTIAVKFAIFSIMKTSLSTATLPVPIVLIMSKFSNLYSVGLKGESSSDVPLETLADMLLLSLLMRCLCSLRRCQVTVCWLADLTTLTTLSSLTSGVTQPGAKLTAYHRAKCKKFYLLANTDQRYDVDSLVRGDVVTPVLLYS